MRRRPYTALGISRVPCAKCGAPSRFQWQVCADARAYRGICVACDVALNRLVLEFVGDPEREAKMTAYVERVR